MEIKEEHNLGVMLVQLLCGVFMLAAPYWTLPISCYVFHKTAGDYA